MEEKYKILIVHNYYQIPGGEDSVVANEKKMLEDHDHEVTLYSRNNSELRNFSKRRKLLLPFTTIFNFRTYKDVKRIIKEQRFDIVHVHNTFNLVSPSVYYAARTCKVPVIQTVHNFRLLCPGATFYRDGHICEDCVERSLRCAVKHRCYRNSKLQTLACVITTTFHRIIGIYGKINYICLTEFNREKLLQLKQIKAKQIFVKPNFVKNSVEIVPQENRENRFIFAGRLDKLKGIDVLLEAWKLMGKNAPKLIVCGLGPMEDWCKEFVENSKVNVELKGFLPNLEVRKLIANSRALILPTRWYEGFPMSIVEAYSVGTPVICSNLGNVGNVVKEGITGCKYSAGSPRSLKQAVHRIDSYPHLYKMTLKEYEEKYTEYENYQQLINIYTRAIT